MDGFVACVFEMDNRWWFYLGFRRYGPFTTYAEAVKVQEGYY